MSTSTAAPPTPPRVRAKSPDEALLKDRRFATRFLGRAPTWIWLAVVLVPGVAAWIWAQKALRGFAGDERTWALWSGNIVLALFVATLFFVARKWSIKLGTFRDWGRPPAGSGDAAWAELQVLNTKIRKGAFANDAEIQAAADEVLRRFHVDKIQRAEIREIDVGGRAVKYVRPVKREPFGRLEPWLEMHMGVGAAGCIGVWFHADGNIRHAVGWTLFLGSAVLLLTGIVLAVLYRLLPEKLARAGGEIPFEEAGVARENYERALAGVVSTMTPELQADVRTMLHRASSPEDLRRRSDEVIARIAAKAPDQAELVRDVVVLAGTRDHLLWTTRTARGLDFQLKLWRWIHVPVCVFVFFVIVLHVFIVCWY